MTLYALVTGVIHKPAETRSSQGGHEYSACSVRIQQKNRDGATETLFASVIAFREEARQTLGRLQPGDAVSVGGPLTVGIWERDGQARPSLSIVAETVAAARSAPKQKRSEASPRPAHTEDDTPFNDEVPF